jgi:hypothetical protein
VWLDLSEQAWVSLCERYSVERYEVTTGDKTMIFPAELTKIQKEVLALLEVTVAAYQ